MTNKRALIFGISSADGSYLTELLHSKGYQVFGTVTSMKGTEDEFGHYVPKTISDHLFNNLNKIEKLLPIDFAHCPSIQFKKIIEEVRPHEIYNFAGISDIFDPWKDSEKTFRVNGLAPQYMLEAIMEVDKSIKFFQASSVLIYGGNAQYVSDWINEKTAVNPILPYGFAKAYADSCIKRYREEFGIFACSGIFGPHESLRRGDKFFSKRITDFAKSVKAGSKDILKVGDLTSNRNIGWAPCYVEATWKMLQADKPKDYIIANNFFDSQGEIFDWEMVSNEQFIEKCFDYIGYNWKNHIEVDESLKRPPMRTMFLDASEIYRDLGWQCSYEVDDIIEMMMKDQE